MQKQQSLWLQEVRTLLGSHYPLRRLIPLLVVLSLVYGSSTLPGAQQALGLGLLLLVYSIWWLISRLRFMDSYIAALVGNPRSWKVYTRHYPLYKYVDIFRAAQYCVAKHRDYIELPITHQFTLSAILRGLPTGVKQKQGLAPYIAHTTGYEQEAYFPADIFWILRGTAQTGHRAAMIRIWLPRQKLGMVMIEVAAQQSDYAEELVETILKQASEHSIYRNHMIRVVFEREVPSSYDEDENHESMSLLFYREEQITADDIILDQAQHTIIEHAIIDFHQRRAELLALGMPGKRGVLFYGPPGTGKTYTCKFIAQQLEQATTIVVTGHSLLHMKSICAIARMLQPALVLLEDIDLVFSHREINAYNTVLGEFIDQLDGFGDTDHIIFILTTNAIDRIEAAIKDRPGRVSQCIFFGPPNSELRRRYLQKMLAPYETESLNLNRIIEKTDQVSQAFLKELVFRAVQIASKERPASEGKLCISQANLEEALHEITQGSGRSAQRIIGFRMDMDA